MQVFWQNITKIKVTAVDSNPETVKLGREHYKHLPNLFCCRNLYYSDIPINDDGTIGKKLELKIDLVVDPAEANEEGYKIVDYKCKI